MVKGIPGRAPTAAAKSKARIATWGQSPNSVLWQPQGEDCGGYLFLTRQCPQRDKARQLLNLATVERKFKGFISTIHDLRTKVADS
jgi:hypothetical protein